MESRCQINSKGKQVMTVNYQISVGAAERNSTPANVFMFNRPDGHTFVYDNSLPEWFEARAKFANKAEAESFAAQFPKACGMKASEVAYWENGEKKIYGSITVKAKLGSDGINGGTNETGLRRIKSLHHACSKLGIALTMHRTYANASTVTIEERGWV
jgi:hypothetical protein